MANCNYTLDMSIIASYLDNYTGNVCCWQPTPLTYDDFLTGITQTYNNSCLEDKTIADYITTLYTSCLSGSSGGGTSYWSANTDGSITPSGFSTSIGIGTNTPDKTLHVKTAENTVAVFESTDATVALKISDSSDDAYIVGKNNMLYISDASGSPSSNAEFAFDYVNGKLGVGTATPNEPLTVVGDISGTTDLHVDNIIYFGSLSGGTF